MEIVILHLIKGKEDEIAYIEFSENGKVKMLSPDKFENRYGDYKSFMKTAKGK